MPTLGRFFRRGSGPSFSFPCKGKVGPTRRDGDGWARRRRGRERTFRAICAALLCVRRALQFRLAERAFGAPHTSRLSPSHLPLQGRRRRGAPASTRRRSFQGCAGRKTMRGIVFSLSLLSRGHLGVWSRPTLIAPLHTVIQRPRSRGERNRRSMTACVVGDSVSDRGGSRRVGPRGRWPRRPRPGGCMVGGGD